MHRFLLPVALLLAFQFVFAQGKTGQFNIIAFGDMPYTLPDDYGKFENLIKSINKEECAFVVDVGDIKSSSTPCSEESYNKVLSYFSTINKPLVYTPGDNEWTDCHKNEAGGYSPDERLAVIRKLFFSSKPNFSKNKLTLIWESADKGFPSFVENAQWDYGAISFGTIHVVGSNNNFRAGANDNTEFHLRDSANIHWLHKIFEHASSLKSRGVVIFIHADMFRPDKILIPEESGFTKFKEALQREVTRFAKPVLLVNGDSHVFLVEKPFFENEALKKSLVNFTRLQVPGESNVHAAKITVDPTSHALFQIQEFIIPENK
jgi:hypothetical protein